MPPDSIVSMAVCGRNGNPGSISGRGGASMSSGSEEDELGRQGAASPQIPPAGRRAGAEVADGGVLSGGAEERGAAEEEEVAPKTVKGTS